MNRREFLRNIVMAIIALVIPNPKEDEIEEFDFYRDYEYNPTTKIATINWNLEPSDKDTFRPSDKDTFRLI